MKLAQVLWVLPLGVVVALLHAWRCDIASAQLGGHPISLGADLFALEGLQDSGTDVTPAAGRGKGGGGGADVADTAAGPGHGIATRSGETAHTSSQRQAQPFGGSCGTQTALIVVGVLAAPTAVSLAARQLIRETWGSYPTNGSLVTRFILGTDKAGKIPALLLIEAQKHKDIVFVDAEDDYHKLAPKVLSPSLPSCTADATHPGHRAIPHKRCHRSPDRAQRCAHTALVMPYTRCWCTFLAMAFWGQTCLLVSLVRLTRPSPFVSFGG